MPDYNIHYTDELVRNMFINYLGMNDKTTKHVLTNAEIAENLKNTDIEKLNQYNYKNVKNTGIESRNLDYAALLRKNLFQGNIATKFLKFIGTQQALMLLNPRMNFLLNPLAVPGFINPNGILNDALDAQFITYPSIVNLPESINSSELGASLGTNIGQIEGSDFQQSTGIISSVQNKLENILSGIFSNSDGPNFSIDPTKMKLVDRLKAFNNISDNEPSDLNKFKQMHGQGNSENYTFEPGGNAKQSLISRENIDKFAELAAEGLNVEQDYLDFGSKESGESWATFNIKSNKKSAGIQWGNDKLHVGDFSKHKSNTNGNEVAEVGKLENDRSSIKNVLKDDNFDAIKELADDQQFPFFFEEIGDSNPGWCIFPATIKSLAENYSPSFGEGGTYFGRTEKPIIYTGTSRTISFNLSLYVEHPKHLQVYKDRVLWLTQRTYAKYHEDVSKTTGTMTIYKNPPLLRLTMGDLYYRVGGFLSSLAVNWSQETNMWEKSIQGSRIPLQCDINVSFTVLHDVVPDGNTPFFDWKNK